MKMSQKLVSLAFVSTLATTAFAAPLPHTIVIQDKAVVPVVKTEIIRTVKGQAPVREVSATVLEVTNKGKDIVSRDIVLNDNQAEFSQNHLSAPVIQKGSVIVPTSKIEVNATVSQGNEVLAEARSIDASGVQFKKGQAPVQRSLQLDQVFNPSADASATHAVIKKDGVITRDIVVINEGQ